MAKTLAALQTQIEKLQAQAAALRAKEAQGVIKRIKEAISYYELSPQDLFDKEPQAKRSSMSNQPPTRKIKGSKTLTKRPIKYADAQGNTWVGHGKRPAWFVQALSEGKTAQDLLVAK